ncbi:acyl-CoA dehydrogenase family protein [Rhodococcoides fascians]|jgi:acyl-CoA dehydrogenase|uniref:acyl-CoA dehydrogenase family protein n=1 Tax=Rhodococcoides fascians TaxID=1828 RepID=UPI003CE8376C
MTAVNTLALRNHHEASAIGTLDVFRSEVRQILAEVILPHADEWEADRRMDKSVWRSLADHGLLQHGLSGPDFLFSAILLEELGRTGYAGIRASIGVHAYMAASYLEMFGTPEQQERYLEPCRRGSLVAGLAISEQGSGSDLHALSTTAVATGAGYNVSGSKTYIANATTADVFITLVKSGQSTATRGLVGGSLLITDAHHESVERVQTPMLGWHSADIGTITFRDTPVPEGALIGRQDRAILHLMRALDFERLAAALLALGGARHCIELLDAFTRAHKINGAPLSAKQSVRQEISKLHSELETTRHYTYHAAQQHISGTLSTRTASIAKLQATELARRAAAVCLQYHGARGYTEDAVPSRIYRDAAAGSIAAGPSELLRDLIYESSTAP